MKSTMNPITPHGIVNWDALLAEATRALAHSYAPYSHFRVGAALLIEDGSILTGVNVENASYGLTLCAERAAIVNAVSRGYRAFHAIAITCSGDEPPYPCGACRQVLHEFAPTMPVRCAGQRGPAITTTVNALLPHAFDLHRE
jgi:homotetrameric cytidine deaminase